MDKNVALDANGNPKGDTSGLGSLALQDYIKSIRSLWNPTLVMGCSLNYSNLSSLKK